MFLRVIKYAHSSGELFFADFTLVGYGLGVRQDVFSQLGPSFKALPAGFAGKWSLAVVRPHVKGEAVGPGECLDAVGAAFVVLLFGMGRFPVSVQGLYQAVAFVTFEALEFLWVIHL